MSDATDTTSTTARTRPLRPAQWLKLAIMVIIIVLVLIWLGLWIRGKIGHVSTSDARVEANVITVSSRLDGQVNDFDLIEGDTLQAGDIIAQLYSKPARLKRARLQADVDRIQAQLSATREQIAGGVKAAKATLAADQAAVDVAKADMQKK